MEGKSMIEISIRIKEGNGKIGLSYSHHFSNATQAEKNEAAIHLALVHAKAQILSHVCAESGSNMTILEGPASQVKGRIQSMFDSLDSPNA